jgi:hypothetical protein
MGRGRTIIGASEMTTPVLELSEKTTYEPTAFGMSASANTIAGDFPPSSRVTLFILLSNASLETSLPVKVDPVKLILSIPMLDASKLPVFPGPLINCMTPGGNPASCTSLATRRALSGDFSEAL